MIGKTVYYMANNRIYSAEVLGHLKSEIADIRYIKEGNEMFADKDLILTCHGRFDKKEVFETKEELVEKLLKGVE